MVFPIQLGYIDLSYIEFILILLVNESFLGIHVTMFHVKYNI